MHDQGLYYNLHLISQGLNGRPWFQIAGSTFSIRGNATMRDAYGHDICGYRRKLLSKHGKSYITIEGTSGTMVVATVQKQFNFSPLESEADIYIHNPPMSIDDVTTSGLPVSIHVVGDKLSKKYDFMIGNLDTNPYKIAQAAQQFQTFPILGPNVLIGSNVDSAFMCICAYAIYNLFSNDNGWTNPKF